MDMYNAIINFFKSLTVVSCIKFFFVGLVCQFMLHTFVTYIIHVPDTGIYSIIWMRKELLIIGLWLRSIYQIYTTQSWKTYIRTHRWLSIITMITIISIVISFIISIGIHQQSIMTFALSAKFNYFPIIILIVWWLASSLMTEKDRSDTIDYIITIVKYVIIFSVCRYALLHTFPNILDRIGYAQPGVSIERTANTPPPSLWLTNFYDGFVRNQWPFSWPLSLGFYMICLFPLFYVKVLYKQKFSHVRYRRVLYGFTTISTFSRATWIMWIIQLLLIAAIVYRRHIIPIIIGSIIGLWWLVWYSIITDQTDIFIRKRSDQWHEKFLNEWITYIKNNRLWWMGAASVWPASYHNDDVSIAFNTENQYMQVWVEYGILWFVSWLTIYILLGLLSGRWRWSWRRGKSIIDEDSLIRAWPYIALCALGVGGMALHPLTDSSSMYPFMMLLWLFLHQRSQPLTEKDMLHFVHRDNRSYTVPRLQLWKYATVIILLFFVIQTQIVNGRWLLSSSIIMSSMRDGIMLLLWCITLFMYKKHLASFLQQYRFMLIVIVWLLLWSAISGYIYETSLLHFLAGIKFDLSYIILLLLWLRRWHCIGQSEKWHHSIALFFQWLWKLLPWMIIAWIIRQWCKILRPELFIHYGWYGLPGDFAPRSHPPMYYITGPWGIPRLSWLFVGPNTLWFFLILFGGGWLYHLRSHHVRKNYLITACVGYLACIIATLSRSAVLAVTIQAIIVSSIPIIEWWTIMRDKIRHHLSKWIVTMIIIISLSGSIVLIMNTWKNTSNGERMSSLYESYALLEHNPLVGYGPWYVWPARHYHPDYANNSKNNLALVENIYLQIWVNLWLPWILLWLWLWIWIFRHIRYITMKTTIHITTKETVQKYLLIMTIGLISLLCVGWFLDIFIDSMVNYLFFIPFGILLWSLMAEKNS